VDGIAYLVADDGVHGHPIWVSDGTPEGTVRISDVKPSGFKPYTAYYAGTLGDAVYFYADDRVHGTELWRTDGTKEGTRLVKDTRKRRGQAGRDGPCGFSAYPHPGSHTTRSCIRPPIRTPSER
jgi:ELWxxDGT repeat protein